MTDTIESKDALGDRMKAYENVESDRRLDVNLPIYVRIDGRGFSKFTAGMDRPYDRRMSDCMVAATKYLVDKTHARMGYTQSDEISLVFLANPDKEDSDVFFNGRIQKLASVISGITTAAFLSEVLKTPGWRDYADKLPHFDARVFQLPSRAEAANAFLWREKDAAKNSVSMACRATHSHKEMHGKSAREMIEMMADRGVDYYAYPVFFRRGTWVRRFTEERTLTTEERERIPEAHRPAEDALFNRSDVRSFTIRNFSAVRNREEVIFDGAEPDVDFFALTDEVKHSISESFVEAMNLFERGEATYAETIRLVAKTEEMYPGGDRQQSFYQAIRELIRKVKDRIE